MKTEENNQRAKETGKKNREQERDRDSLNKVSHEIGESTISTIVTQKVKRSFMRNFMPLSSSQVVLMIKTHLSIQETQETQV